MNKEKAKNITLGVSLILNLLGSLLIGGSLIHACNAPASPEKADLSPVTLTLGKMDGLSPRKAENAVLPAGTYVFDDEITLDDYPLGLSIVFDFRTSVGNYTAISFNPWSPSGGGGADNFTYNPLLASGTANLALIQYRQADNGLYSEVYVAGWSTPAQKTFYVDEPASMEAYQLEFLSGFTTYTAPASSSSSSAPSQSIFDFVKVPATFWGYRALNGSYDANTGGMITTAEIGGIWSGGVRIGGIPFTLGDSDVMYDAIEFYYWNFYGRDFLNEKGEIVRASSDGFKNVLYLDHVSVLPQGLDASTASNWIVIGSAVYGMQDSGSLYTDAHRFNWLDQSYKTFRVERTTAPFADNYAVTGSMTDGMINPTLRNMNRSEALRLALTGTSADVSGGVTIGGDGYADVFGLIGSAFSSLVPILSVQVLPYLTIGTLMLVPLIVLVIFAILKVLNK